MPILETTDTFVGANKYREWDDFLDKAKDGKIYKLCLEVALILSSRDINSSEQ